MIQFLYLTCIFKKSIIEKYSMADAVLIGNLQNQLSRLMDQLSDLERERPNIEAGEYEQLKNDTMEQLEDLSRTLDKIEAGSMTLIDGITATRMAIRAAISEAFRTPEIVTLFARNQPMQIRQKLVSLEDDFRLKKVEESEFEKRKLEILTALLKLKGKLTEEEKCFLKQKQPQFDLLDASTNTVCMANIIV